MKLMLFELEQVWGSCSISALIKTDTLLLLNAVNMTEGGEIPGKKGDVGQPTCRRTLRCVAHVLVKAMEKEGAFCSGVCVKKGKLTAECRSGSRP